MRVMWRRTLVMWVLMRGAFAMVAGLVALTVYLNTSNTPDVTLLGALRALAAGAMKGFFVPVVLPGIAAAALVLADVHMAGERILLANLRITRTRVLLVALLGGVVFDLLLIIAS